MTNETVTEPIIHAPPPAPPPPPADEIIASETKPSTQVQAEPVVLETDSPDEMVPVELDQSVLKFLMSAYYENSIGAIRKKYSIKDDDLMLITDLERLVMGQRIELDILLDSLEAELKDLKSPEQRNALFTQILAEHFVPFGDFIKPSAQEVAQARNLSLAKGAHYQVYFQPLTYSGAATEVASSAGFSLVGGPIRERLRELIISKLKGVRIDAQVTEVLTRGIDFGGLGLDPRTADKTLKAINDILKRAKVLSEDEYANWLSAQARSKEPARPKETLKKPLTPDEEEIANIQAKMPKQDETAASALQTAILKTAGRLTYKPSDEYLSNRLRNVISSRLRDVRSSLELKQLLMRDSKVGGLGLNAVEAESLAKQIEAAYQEFHEVISQEEKTKIDTQLEDQKRKIEERRKREAEEHAKWFEEKIRARKAGETQHQQNVENVRRILAGPTTLIDIKEQRAETTKFGPLVDAAKSGLVDKPTGVKPAQAGPIRISTASAELEKRVGVQPSMDGIKYATPQLVSLVGELKTLTLAEFRRIAKNPQEAVKKIQQKVETLGQESFEKRVEGIQGFQGSPLQASYLALVGESFRTGKQVAALADEKRKAGQDTLSPDEIGAIIQLNSALHF